MHWEDLTKMKLRSKKLKLIVASAVTFLTSLGTAVFAYAEERGTGTVPVIEDKVIYIGGAIFAAVAIIGTCVIGTILRRAQNKAHKEWLRENHLTEEEYLAQAKEYKVREKQRKKEMKARKKARKQAMKQMKK